MTKHRKKSHKVIDLGSDESVRDTIVRAAAGNQSAAWFLIHQIETALRDRRVSDPLFDHAADFFGELLDIHNEHDGRATPRDLMRAFDRLHVVRKRGQPERDHNETLMLAARVVLLREVGFSTDKALGALETLGEFPRSAFRTAYDASGELIERLSPTWELEGLAGESQEALLRRLKAAGGIKHADLQDALEKAKREGGASKDKRTL